MRFSQDQSSNVNLVRGYGAGEIRINDAVFRCAVILAADAIQEEPVLSAVADLGPAHADRLLALQPEVVLIGTGARQIFLEPAFGARFLEAGVGFEVMDTGAACRTFNVLVGEHRRVAALLIP